MIYYTFEFDIGCLICMTEQNNDGYLYLIVNKYNGKQLLKARWYKLFKVRKAKGRYRK